MNEWFASQDLTTEDMPVGHRDRFKDRLQKLNAQNPIDKKRTRVISLSSWKRWSLVAGLTLLLSLGSIPINNSNATDNGLESVSPAMAQAQDFFTSTITLELERLEKAQSPDTERIIADTKKGLAMLEEDYAQIKKDFKINKNNKAVIAAMIQNFQNRIDLLETALMQIDQLNTLKKDESIL